MNRIKDIYEYRDMITSMVQRDLRGRYMGSVLGFLWSFINPLGQILIYTVVFTFIFRTNLESYYIYMVAGLIPWLFFSMSVSEGAMCIRNQSEMVKKIYFPREVLPIAVTTSQFVNMLFCFVVIFFILAVSGFGCNMNVLLFLPVVMMVEYIFTLGCVFLVSCITVYFRDMQQIIGLVLMAWIYATPIMYAMEMIPEKFVKIYVMINPMTPIINAYHNILYYKCMPTTELIIVAVEAIVVLVVGFVIFGMADKNFAEQM